MSKSTYKDEEPITWQLIIKECTQRAGDDVADIFIGVQASIEELEAENERLRVALREIADGKYEHYLASNPSQNAATVFARAALENNDE